MGGKMTIPYNIHKFEENCAKQHWLYQVHGNALDYFALPYFKDLIKFHQTSYYSLNPFGRNVTIKQKKLFYISYPLYIIIHD